MSKESAIRFLRELGTNEKAKELLQGREEPKNEDEAIKAYAEVAAELGEDISPEEIAIALKEIEAEIHQKTESVSETIEELNDDDVENVAGGKRNSGCGRPQADKARDKPEECWFNDKCDGLFRS